MLCSLYLRNRGKDIQTTFLALAQRKQLGVLQAMTEFFEYALLPRPLLEWGIRLPNADAPLQDPDGPRREDCQGQCNETPRQLAIPDQAHTIQPPESPVIVPYTTIAPESSHAVT